jgi:uncharacterized protein (DUF697 family)
VGRLTASAQAALAPLLREALWLDFEDTLRRLLRGDFADLSEAQRRERVEQIVGLSAMAAMAMAAAPVPFLELPVQAAMVRAVARVHGHHKTGRAILWELGAALGGGLVLRQAMRLLPIVGPLPHLSRIYGATWALGRVAQTYYAAAAETGLQPDGDDLRRLYHDTAAARTREEAEALRRARLETALRHLDDLRARAVITETEYRRKRDEVLDAL